MPDKMLTSVSIPFPYWLTSFLFTLDIRNIEAATHQENQSLTLKTISQRYKLEKQKREIEQQTELNKKIKRDITINKGMDE